MPESIRLFSICEGMNWAHLPNEGGIYGQHPELLEQWMVVWEAKKRQNDRDDAKRNKDKPAVAPASKRPRRK